MANHMVKKKRPVATLPTTPDVMSYWPSWRYNPKTGEGAVFDSEEEVPDGWVEHYAETKKAKGEPIVEGPTNMRVNPRAGQQDGALGVPNAAKGDFMSSQDDPRGGGADAGPRANMLDENAPHYADGEPSELEDKKDISPSEIKRRLDARKVPYAASANKDVLYQLLEENWVIDEQ